MKHGLLTHDPAWVSHVASAFSFRLRTRGATFFGTQTLDLLSMSKLVVVRIEKLRRCHHGIKVLVREGAPFLEVDVLCLCTPAEHAEAVCL
jgi:hypothetical protein